MSLKNYLLYYLLSFSLINKKNLVNGCANITGGGLVENLLRSIPENLTLNLDLSKIKVKKIFKWLKSR